MGTSIGVSFKPGSLSLQSLGALPPASLPTHSSPAASRFRLRLIVASQGAVVLSSQPNPPGMISSEGLFLHVLFVSVRMVICAPSAPKDCWNSHQDSASASTGPESGGPHSAVAVAPTVVESVPMSEANGCCTASSPVSVRVESDTVTVWAARSMTGGSTLAAPSLAFAAVKLAARPEGSSQPSSAQSRAIAMAAASAPFCSWARSA